MKFTLALLLMVTPAAAQSPPTPVPLPVVTGPVAVSATSYPLMAAATLQTVVDLPARGYLEEEFFVSGRADVYDWDGGGVRVLTPGANYTTRILLRRPADPRRFSGTAIVEIANVGRGYDFPFTWGVSHDHFMESGDAWVLVTYAPEHIAALKQFNAARYAPLSMASPAPTERCAAAAAAEEGLRWDIISQVGALLRAARADGPLGGFAVERVFATSHGGELATYIAAFHSRARLANGRPVYDGYIQHRHPGLTRLHACGTAPAAADPRQVLRNVDVPVLRIVAQTDVLATFARRREDSDALNDRYRLYEIAGAAHADGSFYPYIPSVADQKKTGFDAFPASWPFPAACSKDIPLLRVPIMTYALDAAFANLARWVRDGVAAPRAERVAVEHGGTPHARVVLDRNGNAAGGVRTPFLDVAVATYVTSTPGEGTCRNLGYKESFGWARLEAMYGSSRNYAARVAESVDRLVRARWLTESDGRKMKAALVAPPVASTN